MLPTQKKEWQPLKCTYLNSSETLDQQDPQTRETLDLNRTLYYTILVEPVLLVLFVLLTFSEVI